MKKNNLSLTITLFCVLFFAGLRQAEANNIAVSNVSLTGANPVEGTVKAQFNISWDNSWRSASNYDAAWVFARYSADGGVTWTAATLKTAGTNPAGFSQGTGTALDIVVPSDKKGAFLQRSATGSGAVSTSSVQLVWDYDADGISNTDTCRVRVFAIEMVYIPTGTFSLGSGGAETSAFYAYPTTTNPYQINSEAEITVGTGTGNLYYPSSTNGGDRLGPIPAAFPKGYAAFYLMKYEISQGQYADFLNTLTSTQAAARYPEQSGSNRHTISGTYPNYAASRPDRACNYLSWSDISAYADWAGLRPMTELEFEKAARGEAAPVANEYAWGTTSITAAVTISGTENGTETITTSGANCNYNNTTFTGGDAGTGPLRCGIFATASSTRAQSGASYYGVMELSGSLWERPVTVGNATGRAFTGLHGDGALNASGDANVTNWPGTDAVGAGYRGGRWNSDATNARVSDRYAAANTAPARFSTIGGRCARTSPE